MACLQLRRRLRQRRNGSPLQLHERRLQMTTSSVTRSSGRHHQALMRQRLASLAFLSKLAFVNQEPTHSLHILGFQRIHRGRLSLRSSVFVSRTANMPLDTQLVQMQEYSPRRRWIERFRICSEKKGSASRISCLLVFTSATTISTYMMRTTP